MLNKRIPHILRYKIIIIHFLPSKVFCIFMNLLLIYEYNLFTHEQYLYSKVINIFTVYFLLVYPSIHLINLLTYKLINI